MIKDKIIRYIISAIILLLVLELIMAVYYVHKSQGEAAYSNTLMNNPVLDDRKAFTGRVIFEPPTYMQTDERWSTASYAEKTIGESGCGLAAFASALSCITQDERMDPLWLAYNVGDSCTVRDNDGILVNDISKFISWSSKYGIVSEGMYWSQDRAIIDLEDGKLVIASVRGRVGESMYKGHIVLLWKSGNEIKMLDPANENNDKLTVDEFNESGWYYFYTIWKEERFLA